MITQSAPYWPLSFMCILTLKDEAIPVWREQLSKIFVISCSGQ